MQTLTLYPLTALAGGFQSSLHFPQPQGWRWGIQTWRLALGQLWTQVPFPAWVAHLIFSPQSTHVVTSDHMTRGVGSDSVGTPTEKIHLQVHLNLVSLNTMPG